MQRIYFLLIVVLALVGCQPAQKETSGKPQIVTTTGMIADATKNIAGNTLDVKALMGSGVDPHLYKATQGDLQVLTDADMVIYNGLHLEGKMGEVLSKLGYSKIVIAAAETIPDSNRKQSLAYTDAYDPHVWFDVSLWKIVTQHVSDQLQTKYPDHKELYIKNTKKFLSKLDSLDSEVKLQIASIPEDQRILITAHDAFEYFGSAYGIEVRGLQGISTLSEFGLKDITDLVNFIVERQIKAVFIETSVSEKAIKAVVEGCKEKGWNVVIGGSLYSDAMGAENTPEGTYIGMVNANVQTIVNALK